MTDDGYTFYTGSFFVRVLLSPVTGMRSSRLYGVRASGGADNGPRDRKARVRRRQLIGIVFTIAPKVRPKA